MWDFSRPSWNGSSCLTKEGSEICDADGHWLKSSGVRTKVEGQKYGNIKNNWDEEFTINKGDSSKKKLNLFVNEAKLWI